MPAKQSDDELRSLRAQFGIPESEEKPIHAAIARRRRQMLVHSCLYYRFNTNIVDDATFDRWARELVHLQKAFPTEAEETVFAEVFRDFDGSTGFYLPIEDPAIVAVAERLLRIEQKRG